MLSFDDYLNDRIAFGKAQIVTFTALFLVQFTLGFEQLLSILLTTLYANYYQITQQQQCIILFCYFSGIAIGNIIVSIFAHKIGRKKLLLVTQLFSVFTLILNTCLSSASEMVFIITQYGLIFGIVNPLSYLLLNEIVPLQIRGRVMTIIQLGNVCGMLYLMVLINIFLELGSFKHVKEILNSNFILPLLSIVFLFFLEESPRFYIMKRAYKQGFTVLNQLGIMNNLNYFDINGDEQQAMIKWQQDVFKGDLSKEQSISILFQSGFLKLTLLLVAMLVIYNIISCGIIVLLLLQIQQMNIQFVEVITIQVVECASLIIIFFIIDNTKYGGRARIIQYGSLIMLIGLIIILRQTQMNFKIVWIILLRSGLSWSQLCLTLLPIESYPTFQRSLGVGLTFGIGNISGAISALFIIYQYQQHPLIIIVLGILLIGIIIMLSICFPIDTTQKPLDYYYTTSSYYLSESGILNSRKGILQQSHKEYSLQDGEILKLQTG